MTRAASASSCESSATSRRPRARTAVPEIGPASARRASSATPAANIGVGASHDSLLQDAARDVEPEDDRRQARFGGPEPVSVRAQRRSELGELQCAHHATAVIRMKPRCGVRIALREDGVRALGPEPVVGALPPRSLLLRRGRWKAQLCERGAKVEAGAAGDDRGPAVVDQLVDRCVRQAGVVGDGALVVQRPDATRRVGRSGCAVRIGRPRYACIESADRTSPPRRSATASATAVLPEAVGPKIATTLGGADG